MSAANIRYYEKENLISVQRVSDNGYRLYSDSEVHQRLSGREDAKAGDEARPAACDAAPTSRDSGARSDRTHPSDVMIVRPVVYERAS